MCTYCSQTIQCDAGAGRSAFVVCNCRARKQCLFCASQDMLVVFVHVRLMNGKEYHVPGVPPAKTLNIRKSGIEKTGFKVMDILRK